MIATKISNTVSGSVRTVKFRIQGKWHNNMNEDMTTVLKAFWYYETIIEAGTQVLVSSFVIPKRTATGTGQKAYNKVITHQISSIYDPDALYAAVVSLEAGHDDARTNAYRLVIKAGGGTSGAWDHPKKPKSIGDDWDGDLKIPFDMATT